MMSKYKYIEKKINDLKQANTIHRKKNYYKKQKYVEPLVIQQMREFSNTDFNESRSIQV